MLKSPGLGCSHIPFPSWGLLGVSACSGHSDGAPGLSSSLSPAVIPLGHRPKSSPQVWFQTHVPALGHRGGSRLSGLDPQISAPSSHHGTAGVEGIPRLPRPSTRRGVGSPCWPGPSTPPPSPCGMGLPAGGTPTVCGFTWPLGLSRSPLPTPVPAPSILLMCHFETALHELPDSANKTIGCPIPFQFQITFQVKYVPCNT